jgi:carbon-monoxide dehydrogenase medium subunit
VREFEYVAPRSVSEAVKLLAQARGRARILAGGTDLIVQLRERRGEADLVVDGKRIPDLNALDARDGLHLGAAVPCSRIYEDRAIATAYPGLNDAVSLIGGIQIQSRASVGGNLCNASPAADTAPALIAHEAICIVSGAHATREIPAEAFCTGPGKTVLQPDELLVGFRFPRPSPRSGASYLRFIPRNEMDIAVVGVGVSVVLDERNDRCIRARIALAAVAPTPLLVEGAGAALIDGPLSDGHFDKAAELARTACRPISDMRGSAEFRRHIVGVLVKRALQVAVARAKGS